VTAGEDGFLEYLEDTSEELFHQIRNPDLAMFVYSNREMSHNFAITFSPVLADHWLQQIRRRCTIEMVHFS